MRLHVLSEDTIIVENPRVTAIHPLFDAVENIFEYPKQIRTLADQYARRIIRKQSVVIVPEKKSSPDYVRVDLNSINNELPRTAGAEHVVYETIKLLEIDMKLIDLGLKPADIAAVIGVICG
jgi:hypothetical protein